MLSFGRHIDPRNKILELNCLSFLVDDIEVELMLNFNIIELILSAWFYDLFEVIFFLLKLHLEYLHFFMIVVFQEVDGLFALGSEVNWDRFIEFGWCHLIEFGLKCGEGAIVVSVRESDGFEGKLKDDFRDGLRGV